MTSLPERTEKLSERLASTLDKLPKDPSPKFVHRLRTTIRRIESLVDYAQPELGRKREKALEKLTTLRKRAGRVRDLDVQRELLKEIANGSTAADRQSLSFALQQRRDKQSRRLLSACKKIAGSRFLSHVDRIVNKAVAAATSTGRENPLAAARTRFSRLETGFLGDVSPKPAQLHQVRIEMKKLRYIAELAEESAEQQSFNAQLKAAQDALGSWHDWQGLARSVEKQFRNRMNCPLIVEARALVAAKQTTATALLRQLFASRPEQPAGKRPRSVGIAPELTRRAG